MFSLGAGAVLGAMDVPLGPRWQLPAAETPWLVFVSDHNARLGFSVRDDLTGGFASAFRALGGGGVAGPAISSTFRVSAGGPVQQVFERLVLHVAPRSRSVVPAPLLVTANTDGFDAFLKRFHGIPAAVTGRQADGLDVGADFQGHYESVGGESVLGAPTSNPTAWKASVLQRFENAVIALHRAGSAAQRAELAPVPVYLRAAGYFPAVPFVPRPLPVKGVFAPTIVWRGDIAQPYVFITIDDCWDAELTRQCLDVARDERLSLTFFPAGAVIREAPHLWRRAVTEGHTVENHTQLHLPLSELSDGRIRWEIEEAGRQLNQALGYPYRQRFFRPPQGAGILDYQERVVSIARALKLHVAMWTVDSGGWMYPRDNSSRAENFVLENIARRMGPGAIILMHAVASDTAALPRLARSIHSDGLQSLSLRHQLMSPHHTVSRARPPPMACEDLINELSC